MAAAWGSTRSGGRGPTTSGLTVLEGARGPPPEGAASRPGPTGRAAREEGRCHREE